MRRVVICSGVLGGGSALVFALAAATATLFPHGTIVPSSQFGWGGGVMIDDMRMFPGGGPIAIPVPEGPVVLGNDGGVFTDESEGKP